MKKYLDHDPLSPLPAAVLKPNYRGSCQRMNLYRILTHVYLHEYKLSEALEKFEYKLIIEDFI